ncbi:GlxA family transcriptional regulator [Pseudomonas sp. NFIX28]|uniref:GlxA family transcriptional regulator n=1 Tax=Pseudomonas sp. NFIX28 TaxID=1566235 RepID=UPI00089B0E84|nr:helix-turn-helix domain-containing protein [Pseudomonas sp. NFIX28]SDZ65428.1 Transcriptional regulator GlxA family, contains an amidase domain and an AraC-type DNA-binding HTH domain [Pseudomonas sp. NFIX28]
MHDFTVLVLPGAFCASVALTLDVLASAAAIASRTGCAEPRWRIYSSIPGPVTLGQGISLQAVALPDSPEPDESIWIVPGLGLDNATTLASRLQQLDAERAIRALQLQASEGGTIAASCSAVFLLQAAGLLRGKKATTSWWLAPQLQKLEPQCRVDSHRMVIADQSIITAGAALAQTDLMLHLLRLRFGASLADAVARVLLIDRRQSQAFFIVPALMSSGDELVSRLTGRIESSLQALPSVGELAAEFGLSERTLARRIKAATGQSPLKLIQGVRLGKARMLIENSRLSIEQIAEQVGYSDATALRRLMRKTLGGTPRQFR